MSLVVSQEGSINFWGRILGLNGANNPTCHLIGSLATPLHTWTLANYAAVELPVANGYAPIVLSSPGANWTLATIGAGATATHNLLTWTFTAALTVWGYYLSDDTSLVSWFGEAFNPAYAFPAGGGVFTLQLPPYLISCPGVSAC